MMSGRKPVFFRARVTWTGRGEQEAGGRREAGGRKQEVGDRRQGAGGRGQEAGGRREAGGRQEEWLTYFFRQSQEFPGETVSGLGLCQAASRECNRV